MLDTFLIQGLPIFPISSDLFDHQRKNQIGAVINTTYYSEAFECFNAK